MRGVGHFAIGQLSPLHRRNPTVVRHRCAQRCDSENEQSTDSENEHSTVTAMVRIVMLQRWQWQRLDISGYDTDVYISVAAMATDTAETAVTTDSAVSAVAADTAVWAMFTLVWQLWQLIVLW